MTQDKPLIIDLNTADVETLDQLPRVGPALARRIVEARPFESLEDLGRVRGIGPGVVDRLRPFLTLPSASDGDGAANPEAEPLPEGTLPEAQVGSVEPEPEPPPEPETFEEDEVELEPVLVRGATEPEDQAAQAERTLERPVPEAEPWSVEPAPIEAEEKRLPDLRASALTVLEVSEETAEPDTHAEPAQDQKPGPAMVTQRRAFWMVAVSSLLTLALSMLISLGILAALNEGQLQFVRPEQLGQMSVRVEGLDARSNALEADIAGLRARLDNMEALSGRVTSMEQAAEQLRTDLESTATEVGALTEQVKGIDSQVDSLDEQARALETEVETLTQRADGLEENVEALQAETDRFQSFLSGLRDLLGALFPAEESGK